MSQRNPLNERYTDESHQGKSRKSAASAKPKTKAAASVHIQSSAKTPQEKKAAQKAARKAERAKQAQLDRQYYNPPTAKYKQLRKIWGVCILGAVVAVLASWFLRTVEPIWLSYAALTVAYAFIIGAIYLDFSKIKKERRRYQEEMATSKSKEVRAAEKQARAAARAEKAEAEQKYNEAKAAEDAKPAGLFGRLKKKNAAENATDAGVTESAADAGVAKTAADAGVAKSAADAGAVAGNKKDDKNTPAAADKSTTPAE